MKAFSETFEGLREEEEESEDEAGVEGQVASESAAVGSESVAESQASDRLGATNDTQVQVDRMLENVRSGQRPQDDSMETITDAELNKLSYQDFPTLW